MPGPQRDMRVRDLAELDAIDKQVIAILSMMERLSVFERFIP